jgi:hypothetical protein
LNLASQKRDLEQRIQTRLELMENAFISTAKKLQITIDARRASL